MDFTDTKPTVNQMRNRKTVLLAILLPFAILTGFFWQNIIASSPYFFGYRSRDLFGIYIAKLDGSDIHSIAFDEKRELSHPRISPDGKHITFTRYNRVLSGGLAEESGSDYLHTEVVIADVDGSHQISIEPTSPDVLNANSSWIDNDTVLYIHKSDLKSLPELRLHHLSSNTKKRLPTPLTMAASDPHCVRDRVVFAVIPIDSNKSQCCLFTMNLDGSDLKQLTNPNVKATSTDLSFKLGDYDPWLSPNADTVVFMRYFGGTDWRVISVNVNTKVEQVLTAPGVTSAIPEWSSDGKAIVFANFDKSKLENLGLYVMSPSGTNKQKIPLPGGYLYTHPSFLTGTGSSSNAAITYGARRVPGLPGAKN